MTSIMTAPSLQLKVMKMASTSPFILVLLVLLGLAASSNGLEQTCGLFAIAGMDVTVPLEYKLQSGDTLKWKRGNTVIFDRKGSNVKTGKAEDVSENGSLILKKVSKTDENLYAPEIYDSSGKNQGSSKEIQLCVLAAEAVKKPTLTASCKNAEVTFTCTPNEKDKDVEIKWFENKKDLLKGNSKTLSKTFAEVKNKKIHCQVSNKASSEDSNALEASCSGGTFWSNWSNTYIWILVAGGGGVVLLLVVLIIVCCIRNRRRRRMRMRDEMEFRLNHTNPEHHHPHPHQQQQHPPLPRERQQNQHRQQPAGNTGPRQNCSRHQRQRASEPTNGNPQPSPRRAAQAPKAANQNDGEVPPPLPQPRKKGPRTQQH
ncbi:T-cell surface antigen CD2 [Oryzias melastigma]|uniref:T-cell surface antigen CD2 n=1 Tax=Oryzias melastigma TaxID=30732 RepID=A0A834FNL9_ORYME|nr:uncharacterized protein LOC112142212 [Oryzias melastigma]KAF6737177.1 T-cell surface antigen CD2 [Oryzias melastigma]